MQFFSLRTISLRQPLAEEFFGIAALADKLFFQTFELFVQQIRGEGDEGDEEIGGFGRGSREIGGIGVIVVNPHHPKGPKLPNFRVIFVPNFQLSLTEIILVVKQQLFLRSPGNPYKSNVGLEALLLIAFGDILTAASGGMNQLISETTVSWTRQVDVAKFISQVVDYRGQHVGSEVSIPSFTHALTISLIALIPLIG